MKHKAAEATINVSIFVNLLAVAMLWRTAQINVGLIANERNPEEWINSCSFWFYILDKNVMSEDCWVYVTCGDIPRHGASCSSFQIPLPRWQDFELSANFSGQPSANYPRLAPLAVKQPESLKVNSRLYLQAIALRSPDLLIRNGMRKFESGHMVTSFAEESDYGSV